MVGSGDSIYGILLLSRVFLLWLRSWTPWSVKAALYPLISHFAPNNGLVPSVLFLWKMAFSFRFWQQRDYFSLWILFLRKSAIPSRLVVSYPWIISRLDYPRLALDTAPCAVVKTGTSTWSQALDTSQSDGVWLPIPWMCLLTNASLLDMVSGCFYFTSKSHR